MNTAIMAAAETYAKLGNYSLDHVLSMMQEGNQIVIRSVLMLMEATV